MFKRLKAFILQRRALKHRNKVNKKHVSKVITFTMVFLLTVSLFVMPCFAEYNPNGNIGSYPYPGQPNVSENNGVPNPSQPSVDDYPNIKDLFYSSYGISSQNNDALCYLMDSIYWVDGYNYVYQFTIPTVNSAVSNDEPLTFNDINTANGYTCILDKRNNNLYYTDSGHWQTQYTTSGTSRTFFFKWYNYNGESFTDALSIRIKYDYNSRLITESSISSSVYPINTSNPSDISIATCSSDIESMVMQYAVSNYYLNFSVSANYETFSIGAISSFGNGWTSGYNNGYTEGRTEWYDRGLDEGYSAGYVSGYMNGYDNGYDDAGGGNDDDYDRGYQDAVNDIKSGDFGRNILGGIFTAPLDALEQFTIVRWTTEGGHTISISIITILSAIVGLTLFIWFLKMFAGG